ncbi:MAG TPA: hypothetical protein VF148_05380 [Acidimicrobiia bacterium]
MRSRRLNLLTFVFALIIVACAAEDAGSTSTTEGGQVSTTQPSDRGSGGSPDSTEAPASTTTTAAGETGTTSGRPLAPDFSLELGEGGTYTLSEGAKPVYLVFWAEW